MVEEMGEERPEIGEPQGNGVGQGVSDKYLQTLILTFELQLTSACIISLHYPKTFSKSLLLQWAAVSGDSE